MTKNKPYILCPECNKFDYVMNRSGMVSFDVYVSCECDYEYPECPKCHKPIYLDDGSCNKCFIEEEGLKLK
jgi:hypothetical protein